MNLDNLKNTKKNANNLINNIGTKIKNIITSHPCKVF